MRRAVIAYDVPEKDFPVIVVLVYGAYFSMLLILLYLPAFLKLQKLGQILNDKITELGTGDKSEDAADEIKLKEKLENLLQINESAQQRLKAGIAVLSPLISGIMSILVK